MAKVGGVWLIGVVCVALLVGGVLGYLVGSLLSPKPTLDVVRFTTDWSPGCRDAVYLYLALGKGYFEDEGISVHVFRGYGATKVCSDVDAGLFEFGKSELSSVILNRHAGGHVKAIATLFDQSPMGWASFEEKGIVTPKDFEGHVIGVQPGGVEETVLPVFAEINGVDMDKITTVSISSDIAIGALAQGTIDVFHAWEGAFLEVIENVLQKEMNFIAVRDYGFNWHGPVLVARDDFIEENPGLVRRFIRAMSRGVQYAVEHPDEAVDALLEYHPELDEDILQLQLPANLADVWTDAVVQNGWGWFSDVKVEDAYNILSEAYDFTEEVPLNDIYTNEFLPEKTTTSLYLDQQVSTIDSKRFGLYVPDIYA